MILPDTYPASKNLAPLTLVRSQDMESQEQPDYNQGYFSMPRELRAACAQVHKNTSQLVEFIAEQTFGWHARWVYLTYDEIRNGRKKANGERMGPGSFLTQDKTVRRAIVDALDESHPLIEVRYLEWGTAYAIHKRFWHSSKLLPKWEYHGRTSYSPQDDPLDEEQATVKKTAQPLQEEPEEPQNVQTLVKKTATDYQIDSNQQSKRQQATSELTDETVREHRPQEARRVPIDTSLDTSKIETDINTFAASPIGSPPSIHISKEKTEDEHNTLQAPRSERNKPTQEEIEEAARRAAELEQARERQAQEKREAEAQMRRELAAIAIAGYQRDLDKAQAGYNSLKEQGAHDRALQSADDAVKYYQRLIRDEEAKR